MGLAKAKQALPLYERDFYEWTHAQARALRQSNENQIDWDNVAEEIESLGRNDKRSLESHFEILVAHLLKCLVQPSRRTRSWDVTIREQRKQIAKLLRKNPSLQDVPATQFSDLYADAVWRAARDTGLQEGDFPAASPFTLGEIFDPNFTPVGENPDNG